MIKLEAERNVAYQSPDHIVKWGTKRDNSRNPRFNQKLYELFPHLTTINILDLGCSGGGFVRDCLNDGHLAVGLEGSDYSKRCRRAEWATIPDSLFTCDVTGDFQLSVTNEDGVTSPLEFDVVTSWELIEHISEEDLPTVAANVKRHLKPDGIWIMSVSPVEEVIDGQRLHQTVQNRDWWMRTFGQSGLRHIEPYVRYFNTQFVRGPKQDAPGSFHLVLARESAETPPIPRQRMRTWLFDRWLMSKWQRRLARYVVGVS